jgi:hypothetical protein
VSTTSRAEVVSLELSTYIPHMVVIVEIMDQSQSVVSLASYNSHELD